MSFYSLKGKLNLPSCRVKYALGMTCRCNIRSFLLLIGVICHLQCVLFVTALFDI